MSNSPPPIRKPRLMGVVFALVSVSLGVLAAEGFTRLVQPFPIFFSTWFDPGIHQRDPGLGYVYTPGYRGGMRHRDNAWYVPLELDERGLREPVSTSTETPGARVVLMGGASMGFSYGLPGPQTLAAQIAKNSTSPVTVETLSWPSFNFVRDLRKYERFVDPSAPPSLVILFLYDETANDLATSALAGLPRRDPDDLFRYHESVVVNARGQFSRLAGRFSFQSYVGAGVLRELDAAAEWTRRARGLEPIDFSRITFRHWKPLFRTHLRGELKDGERPSALSHLRDRLRERGTELVIVALPAKDKVLGPEPLDPLLPAGALLLDLRRLLAKDERADWRADGHYGPVSAKLVGGAIAEHVQRYLGPGGR